MSYSSSPAVLPISNPTTTTNPTAAPKPTSVITTTAIDSQAPPNVSASRAFIGHVTTTIRNGLSQRRPWSELADRSAFYKPESSSDATLRIRKNYAYFRVNYFIVMAAVVAISLITNPFSLLLLLALLFAWLFLYAFRQSDAPLVLLGRTFSDRETLGLLILSTVVIVFLTSVGTVLISALLIGLAIVCTHAAFRAPDDLFLDEQETAAATGFLSFLSGDGAAAISAVPPRI